MTAATPWPVELRYRKGARLLEIDFENGATHALAAELLRVESPSAEVRGHTPSQKQVVPGKRLVGISRLEPVGHYAVRIVFDDGHDSGLFTWGFLHELGETQAQVMRSYEAALESRGLSRDP
jgi:DUF971 family protein